MVTWVVFARDRWTQFCLVTCSLLGVQFCWAAEFVVVTPYFQYVLHAVFTLASIWSRSVCISPRHTGLLTPSPCHVRETGLSV
jgi:hypothetical protein